MHWRGPNCHRRLPRSSTKPPWKYVFIPIPDVPPRPESSISFFLSTGIFSFKKTPSKQANRILVAEPKPQWLGMDPEMEIDKGILLTPNRANPVVKQLAIRVSSDLLNGLSRRSFRSKVLDGFKCYHRARSTYGHADSTVKAIALARHRQQAEVNARKYLYRQRLIMAFPRHHSIRPQRTLSSAVQRGSWLRHGWPGNPCWQHYGKWGPPNTRRRHIQCCGQVLAQKSAPRKTMGNSVLSSCILV